MFHIEDVLQLKDTEDIKLLARRHSVTMFPGLLLALALIVIPFFFLFPLFSWGWPGLSLFVISALAGILISMRTVLIWDADVLIVSTLRLIDVDQKGVFSRFVTEIPLSAVRDVVWRRKGIVDTVFNVGSLDIQAADVAQKMIISRVGKPESIHELINDLRHATQPKRADVPPEKRERVRRLAALLEALPDDVLDRVENAIKAEDRGAAVEKFLHNDAARNS